ncbi:sensor histidine kinase [Kineobactrum salinum]|uniref:histidine kinase n=1 Tax=Kineobactrum salinum TaxID=2708301 RepID=A0A6C0TZ81_9GAMM|nr:HAMP domain-containing sensor histidine kinase [Kineobactrum salinum]QIB64679.1 HAMP domain-containing histidine kinase [Kineobactrum salinum]
MLQLVLVGFFAALAPLCVAILFSVQALEELATSDREVTRRVMEATRLGQEIQAEALEMERHARQYLALSDPELATLFESERLSLGEKLFGLQARVAQPGKDLVALLQAVRTVDLAGARAMATEDGDLGRAAALLNQSFAAITEHRRGVQQWLTSSVDQLLEENAAEAGSIVDGLVIQLSFLVFATLALLVSFSYWINKPVQDLTEEIHRLGTAGLSHTIEISGPQEMAALGEKLEWLRQRLHETDQQKAQFLRHISHELKTPLSSLREGTDLLAEQVTGRLSQQQQSVVEIVRQNGIELQRLIESLLDYNQLPGQELNIEEFDMSELWRELLDNYRISIEQKALQLETRGTVDSWVADRGKLKSALDNLLSNAVNYTPESGSIDIVWQGEGDSLAIEVANTGSPIPEEDSDRVFEPFFQSVAKRSGPIKGSGIGLSVARECIEAQGGSLALITHSQFPVCFRLLCPAH